MTVVFVLRWEHLEEMNMMDFAAPIFRCQAVIVGLPGLTPVMCLQKCNARIVPETLRIDSCVRAGFVRNTDLVPAALRRASVPPSPKLMKLCTTANYYSAHEDDI